MLKAYLAHSCDDNPHLDRVVDRLGRARVVYDKMYFRPGEDFRESIRRNLTQANLFVLFASGRSLASTWVRFEVAEAELLHMQQRIGGVLVIVIDRNVKLDQLPTWMRRGRVVWSNSPAYSYRLIQERLTESATPDRQPLFIGREDDLKVIADGLIPVKGGQTPRLLTISGLEGVGRRSFVRHALRNYLSLNTGPEFHLEATDSLDKMHVQLLDETTDLGSRSELAAAIKEFQRLEPARQGLEIARLMSILAQENTAPVVVDHGSLLNQEGTYREATICLFEALKSFDNLYVVLVHNRRPAFEGLAGRSPQMLYHALRPLNQASTESLLFQSLRRRGAEPSREDIQKLAPYLDGYPPAVEWAVNQISVYGLPVVLADQFALGDYKARAFSSMLKSLSLSASAWAVLRLLAELGGLPIEALEAVEGTTHEDMATILRHLIDLSLVLPSEGYYEISAPIKQAVQKLRGPITRQQYQVCAQKLRETFWHDDGKIPPVRIVDATIHSLTLSGMEEALQFRDLTIPSRLVRMAKELYDSHNRFDPSARQLAIQLAKRALELDQRLDYAREILCKSYVREERWSEAQAVLAELEGRRRREALYLKGFFEWKRGRLRDAVSAFRSAQRAGDRSQRVVRDLAGCLFYLGEVQDAMRVISQAPDRVFQNKYVLDLASQIAIEAHRFQDAWKWLRELARFGTEADVSHRTASLYLKQSHLPQALIEADKACGDEAARFEFFGQRVKILLELGSYQRAEGEVNNLHPTNVIQRDVQTGLKCDLALKQGDWRAAEILWRALQNKELQVHIALYKKLLRLKVQDPTISLTVLKETQLELEKAGEAPDLILTPEDPEDSAEQTDTAHEQ